MNATQFDKVNAAAAAQASSALEKLTGQAVDVKLTRVQVLRGRRDHRSFERAESVVGIELPITGGIRGGALLCIPRQAAYALGERLLKGASGARKPGMEDSALKELGNIICGRYLAVLSNELHDKILPGLPRLSRGEFGPLSEETIDGLSREFGSAWCLQVEVLLLENSTVGDLLIFIKNRELLADWTR